MTKFKCWFTHQNCTELNVAAINPSQRNWKLNVVVNNQIFKYNHLRLGELNVAFNNQLTNWKIECCNQSCIFAKQASSVDSFKHNPCRSIVNVGACTFRPANTSIFQKMNFSWFHCTLTHWWGTTHHVYLQSTWRDIFHCMWRDLPDPLFPLGNH